MSGSRRKWWNAPAVNRRVGIREKAQKAAIWQEKKRGQPIRGDSQSVNGYNQSNGNAGINILCCICCRRNNIFQDILKIVWDNLIKILLIYY